MLIYWYKKDFRILDNSALDKALELCRLENLEFLPVMGIESDLVQSPLTSYEFGKFWQFGAVAAIIPLYLNYNHYGITAGLFYESIISYLESIWRLKRITYLISHQEHGTNGTFERDKEVELFCQKHNIKWIQIQPSGIVRNLKSRDTRDAMVKQYLNQAVIPIPLFASYLQYKVNSNFWDSVSHNNSKIASQFADLQKQIGLDRDLKPTSEKNALSTLQDFTTDRASGYRGGISSPNSAIVSGSRLSQFLAFGSVSVRLVYQNYWTQIKLTEDKKIRAGILGSMQRLFWREHFVQRIETSANMPDVAINPDFDNISYTHDPALFEAFRLGCTGEPLIDACIRCLNSTGFINFRMRAMLISYAVFGLDLNWREVGRYLATVFLDYEPGIHWSQIQMQSGVTGINTIRVYSPSKQLVDQDSDCIFVKIWITELVNLDNADILNYNKTNLYELTNGKYPQPIVDFKTTCKLNKVKTFAIRKTSSKETAKATFVKHGSRKKVIKAKKTAINKSV